MEGKAGQIFEMPPKNVPDLTNPNNHQNFSWLCHSRHWLNRELGMPETWTARPLPLLASSAGVAKAIVGSLKLFWWAVQTQTIRGADVSIAIWMKQFTQSENIHTVWLEILQILEIGIGCRDSHSLSVSGTPHNGHSEYRTPLYKEHLL